MNDTYNSCGTPCVNKLSPFVWVSENCLVPPFLSEICRYQDLSEIWLDRDFLSELWRSPLLSYPPFLLAQWGDPSNLWCTHILGFRRQRSTKYLNVRRRAIFIFCKLPGSQVPQILENNFPFFLRASDNESTTESRGDFLSSPMSDRRRPLCKQRHRNHVTDKRHNKIIVPKQRWAKQRRIFLHKHEKGVGRAILGLLSNRPSSQFFLASLPPSPHERDCPWALK